MGTEKWFDRKFNFFELGPDDYGEIYMRLKAAPDRLRAAVAGLAEGVLVKKPEGGWSIKEHAGHLWIMEPIWRVRFHDIEDRKPELSAADLSNRATTEANFNSKRISALLDQFVAERNTTLALLDNMEVLDESRTSMHPRLQQPMRMIDLAYFVAEHDDHHIQRIREIAFL